MKKFLIGLYTFCFLFIKTHAQESITINYNDTIETIEHIAAGLLHPFSDDGSIPADSVMDEVYHPLNIKFIRTRDVEVNHAKDPDATIVYTIGHLTWGKADGGGPGPWTDWARFDSLIRARVIEIRDQGINPIYDTWNEPDGGSFDFPDANDDSLYQVYKHIHDIVRVAHPEAQVTGLGFENLNSGIDKITDFVDFAIANNCVPDMWNWHFGGDNQETQIQAVKDYCRNAGTHDVIGIFEYLNGARVKYPGRTAYQMAVLEENEVEVAIRANFSTLQHIPGSLSGNLIFPTTDKRGTWWVYEQYGNMTGQRLNYTSSHSSIRVIAAVDNQKAMSEMIIGSTYSDVNNSYTGQLDFLLSNIKSNANGTVKLTVQEIPYNNNGAVNFLPDPVIDEAVPVTSGNVSFTINYQDGASAFKVTISDIVQSDFEQTENIALSSLTVSDDELTLTETRGKDLDFTVEPENTTETSFIWSSLDEDIATVGVNGFVNPLKAGTAQIVIMNESGTFSDTSQITVSPFIHVNHLEFLNDTLIVPYNEVVNENPTAYLNLAYDIGPENAMDKSVVFSSLTPDVINIQPSGIVNDLNEGRARLVIESVDGNLKDTVVVFASSNLAFSQLTIVGDSTLFEDDSVGIKAYDNDEDTRFNNSGNQELGWIQFYLEEKKQIDNIDVLFFRSDSRTYPIEVTINGTVVFDGETEQADDYWSVPIKPMVGDTITIRMTGPNSTGHEWFPIYEFRLWNLSELILMNDLSLSGCVDSVSVDSTIQLSASYTPANATDERINWYSSNEAVAIVTGEGQVEFIAPGNVTLMAESLLQPDLNRSCEFVVYEEETEEEITGLGFTEGLSIFPNPVTSNSFTINWYEDIENIKINDLQGRIIPFDYNPSEKMIIIRRKAQGVLIVQFKSGREIITQKILVK